MLETLFKGILNVSLYATVVAVVIILIKGICGKRLSPDFHYGIWILFLLKLVLPFDIKSMFSIFTLFNHVAPVPVMVKVNTILPPMTTGTFVQTANHQSQSLTTELPVVAKGIDLWNVAAILWLIGIMVMLAVLLFSYMRTNRIIKATSKKPDDRLFDMLAMCKAELKIHCDVPVCTTMSFGIPFLFGFIKPIIILPVHMNNELSDEGIKAILSHELMHVKRRDYLVNLILFLLKSVYWFNPIVWLSFAWMKNDGERACDSAVVRNYSTERCSEYARALLDVAACVGKRTHFPAVSAFTEGNFKERVKNILTARRYSYITTFAAVLVVVIAGIVLLTGAKGENVINNPGIMIDDKNVLPAIQAAITAKINDTIQRDIIVCKRVDRYYFAMIQHQHYDPKSKEFIGAIFNTVYVFEDTGANGVQMLGYTSNEMAYSPGFGVGSSRYGDYSIMYGNLNKSAWVSENDTRRDTNYRKMAVTYGDGTTTEENVVGQSGYIIISKAPKVITGFTLYDKDRQTTKDDQCDTQYIENLNAETQFYYEDQSVSDDISEPSLLTQIDDPQNSKDINFTNGYQSNIVENEYYYVAELGSLKKDSKQGIAVIKKMSIKDNKIIKEERLLTPEKHGAISTTVYNAFNISVKTDDGYEWILNIFDGFRTVVQE